MGIWLFNYHLTALNSQFHTRRNSLLHQFINACLIILITGLFLLSPTAAAADTKTWTSDTDYSAGTLTNTRINGTNNEATVTLSQNPAETLTVTQAVLNRTKTGMSCVQNSATNKIYCFGGNMWYGQILEYNPASPNTSPTVVSTAFPNNNSSPSCVENSATHKIYCFGGYNNSMSQYVSAIVEFDPATYAVTTKTATLPTARTGLSCTEDSSTHKIYCLGGVQYVNYVTTYLNQIVEYDPAAQDDNAHAIVIKTTTLPTARESHACAENPLTHKIYCFGGTYYSGSWQYLNQIVEYDPAQPDDGSGLSIKTATLATVTKSQSCVTNATSNTIYCFGGYNNTASLNISRIDEYNPAGDTITTKTNTLPTARSGTACAVNSAASTFYCFGGTDHTGNLSQIIEYATNLPVSYYSDGSFISEVFDAGIDVTYNQLLFTITKPSDTDVKFQIRTASSYAGLSSTPWVGPTDASDYYTTSGTTVNTANNGKRWAQVKAFFSTTDSDQTAVVSDITMSFTSDTSSLTSTTVTHTSDTDFTTGTTNAGVMTHTTINGTGDGASIRLSQAQGSTLTVKTGTLNSGISGIWLPGCALDSSTGKIYCFGGEDWNAYLNSVTEYDPFTDTTVTKNAELPIADEGFACAEDSLTHKIYCFGGYNGNANEIREYNPAIDSLTEKNAVLPGFTNFDNTCVENSTTHKIYCFGNTTSIYEYDPAAPDDNSAVVTKTAAMPDERYYLGCAEDSSTNKIYCFGGYESGSGYKDEVIEYDPLADQVTVKAAVLPQAKANLGCAEDSATHTIYCFGGDGYTSAIVAYNPGSDQLTVIDTRLPAPLYDLRCMENPGTHRIFCMGGYHYVDGYDERIYEFNPTQQLNYSGYYDSPIINAGGETTFGTLSFSATTPANTALTFKIRSAETQAGIYSATWYGPTSTSDYYSSSGQNIIAYVNGSRYVQYRAYLTSNDSSQSPSLDDITLSYDYRQYTTGSGSITHRTIPDFNQATLSQATVTGTNTSPNAQLNTSSQEALENLNTTLPSARESLSCVENSANNHVICLGGYNSELSPNFYLNEIVDFDPNIDSIVTKTATLPVRLQEMGCAEDSSSNKIYCFGGNTTSVTTNVNTIYEYDPAGDSIVAKASVLPSKIKRMACVENSANHKIYCLGGYKYNNVSDFGVINTIFEYTPATDSLVTKTATLPQALDSLSCTEDPSTHKIYCFKQDTLSNAVIEYDPAAVDSSDQAIVVKSVTLPYSADGFACATNAITNKIYCFGGYIDSDTASKIFEYNPATNSAEEKTVTIPPFNGIANLDCASNSSTGTIYCFGGVNNAQYSHYISKYTPAQYYSSGDFISLPIDTGQTSIFSTLDFTGIQPTNTTLKFQIRSASAQNTLASATWYGPTSISDYYTVSGTSINEVHDGSRWLQYKTYFESSDLTVSPQLNTVAVGYTFTSSGDDEPVPSPSPTPSPTPQPNPAPQPTTAPIPSAPNTSVPTFSSDPPPASPPDLFEIDTTDDSATLYFTPSTGPLTHYHIIYGEEPENPQYGVEVIAAPSSGVEQYTVNNLQPETTYYFQILPGNGGTPGDWSQVLGAKTNTTGDTAVTSFHRDSDVNNSTPRIPVTSHLYEKEATATAHLTEPQVTPKPAELLVTEKVSKQNPERPISVEFTHRVLGLVNWLNTPITWISRIIPIIIIPYSLISLLSNIRLVDLRLHVFQSFTLFIDALRRRKVKSWGVVYDSKTKLPVDPVILRLINDKGDVVDTRISDVFGRFGFLVEPGTYRLEAQRHNYTFPSKKISGRKDGIYDNLYYGKTITVRKPDLVNVNIPLDPIGYDFNQTEKLKRKIITYNPTTTYITFTLIPFFNKVGFVASLIVLVTSFSWFNLFITTLYPVVWLIRLINPATKQWVVVFWKKTHEVLAGVKVEFVSPVTKSVIFSAITDRYGRYYPLVSPGTYYLTVSKVSVDKNLISTSTSIYRSQPFTIDQNHPFGLDTVAVNRKSIVSAKKTLKNGINPETVPPEKVAPL